MRLQTPRIFPTGFAVKITKPWQFYMSLFCTSVATYIPCYHIVSTFASNLLSSLICWNVTLEHIIKVKIAFFSPLRRQSSTHTSEFSVPARLHRWKLRTGKRLINQQFELRTRNSIQAISRRYCTRKTPLMDVAQKVVPHFCWIIDRPRVHYERSELTGASVRPEIVVLNDFMMSAGYLSKPHRKQVTVARCSFRRTFRFISTIRGA